MLLPFFFPLFALNAQETDISIESCRASQKLSNLNKMQVLVLTEAMENQYSVVILHQADWNQTVVLFGESHLVTLSQHELGKRVVDSFSLIGMESLKPECHSPFADYSPRAMKIATEFYEFNYDLRLLEKMLELLKGSLPKSAGGQAAASVSKHSGQPAATTTGGQPVSKVAGQTVSHLNPLGLYDGPIQATQRKWKTHLEKEENHYLRFLLQYFILNHLSGKDFERQNPNKIWRVSDKVKRLACHAREKVKGRKLPNLRIMLKTTTERR